ncbi:hypothetical protein ACFRAQ_34900 [Nocardia sp. NPDC056611]|uniref:DNA polymerase III subunit beta family protein n=1 Tax=Nocardia sp. NPDC056611 TaxID=3345877 RepID=UPI00366C3085
MATFTADLKVLAGDLLFIRRATGFRYAMVPALELLAVMVGDGVAAVSFYPDFETAVTTRMAAEGDDVSFAVNIKALADAVKAAGGKGVGTFTVDGEALTISAGGVAVNVSLAGDEARSDMVKHPVPDGKLAAILSGADLARMGSVTATSVGTDDTLPMLTGVRLECAGLEVRAVTTDRFSLAVTEAVNAFPVRDEVGLLVPGLPFHHFAKRAGKAGDVLVSVSLDGTVWFESDDCTLSARQLDSEFPKWQSLMGFVDSASIAFTFDPAALLKAAKAMPKGIASTMYLHIDGAGVKAVGHSHESQFSEMTLDVAALECDNPLVIKFSAEKLAAILGAVPKGAKVEWRFSTPSRPGFFSWDSERVLLMPIRLPS